MADIHVTIPLPVNISAFAFSWELYLEPDHVLISSGTDGNITFPIHGLDAGDYKFIVSYLGGENVAYCFNIPSDIPTPETCFCPDISVIFIVIDDIPYLKFTFDLPQGFPSCPLTLFAYSDFSGFDTTLIINDSSQLTFNGGTEYFFLIPCDSAIVSPSYGVIVTNGDGLRCLNITVNADASTAPSCLRQDSVIATLIRDVDDLIHIQLHVNAQASAPPYTDITIYWQEQYGTDSGSQVITLSPTDVPPYDLQIDPALTPSNPWTNSFGGLYHNTYIITMYSGCNFYESFTIAAPAP